MVAISVHKKGDLAMTPNPLIMLASGCLRGVAHFEHLPPTILTAMRADPVRQHHLVTLGAFHQFWHAERIMGAATIL
jgi:hypothetical protein